MRRQAAAGAGCPPETDPVGRWRLGVLWRHKSCVFRSHCCHYIACYRLTGRVRQALPPLPVARCGVLEECELLPLPEDEVQPGVVVGQAPAAAKQQLGAALQQAVLLGVVFEYGHLKMKRTCVLRLPQSAHMARARFVFELNQCSKCTLPLKRRPTISHLRVGKIPLLVEEAAPAFEWEVQYGFGSLRVRGGDGDEEFPPGPNGDGISLHLRVGLWAVHEHLEADEVVGGDEVVVRFGVEQQSEAALVVGAVESTDLSAFGLGLDRPVAENKRRKRNEYVQSYPLLRPMVLSNKNRPYKRSDLETDHF